MIKNENFILKVGTGSDYVSINGWGNQIKCIFLMLEYGGKQIAEMNIPMEKYYNVEAGNRHINDRNELILDYLGLPCDCTGDDVLNHELVREGFVNHCIAYMGMDWNHIDKMEKVKPQYLISTIIKEVVE